MWSDRYQGTARTLTVEAEPFRYRQVNGNSSEHPAAARDWSDEEEDPSEKIKEAQLKAFEQGKVQGAAEAKAAAQEETAAERAHLLSALEKFKEERYAYFSRIESEVVHLALAIARKILHREAQIDPLLLTGMVHVALDKLDAGSRVRMRTHPLDIRLWTDYFAQQVPRSAQIELIGDPSLRRGACVLETETGTTQMSLDGQLKEIEQGFLDLLEHRPPVS